MAASGGKAAHVFPARLAGRRATNIAEVWNRLAVASSEVRPFDPDMVADLPSPARRWLTHSIAPGTPLCRTAVLEMDGHLRLGRWLPMDAMEVLSPPLGFLWVARVGWGPLSFRGFDRYAEDRGEMLWRLPGQVPIVRGSGPDIDRSAAGRLAGEAIWTPASFLAPGISWHACDDRVVTAKLTMGQHEIMADLTVSPDGRLLGVTVRRWGNRDRGKWNEIPFGGAVEEERTFDGMTIPTRMTVGWFYGTDRAAQGKFFRVNIRNARFL